MKSHAELWSFDPKRGRSVQATLGPSETYPNKFELDMKWTDGEPVQFPVSLTGPDLRNLASLILEAGREAGVEILETDQRAARD